MRGKAEDELGGWLFTHARLRTPAQSDSPSGPDREIVFLRRRWLDPMWLWACIATWWEHRSAKGGEA